MATKRPGRRIALATSADAALLDAFFLAFSEDDGGKLAARICEGCVTGAALADKLQWTPDKVSRWTDDLREGGVVEKRRDRWWMRMTPQLAGVEAAQAWTGALRDGTALGEAPETPREVGRRRRQLLADEGRRRLLTVMRAAPRSTQAELIRVCGLPQPEASRGLTRLVDTGFARVERVKGQACYTLQAEAVENLWAWTQSTRDRLAKGRETASAVVLQQPAVKARSQTSLPSPTPTSEAQPDLHAVDVSDGRPNPGLGADTPPDVVTPGPLPGPAQAQAA